MKLTFALLLTLGSFASADMVKSGDGRTVECINATNEDVTGYRPTEFNIAGVGGDSVKMTVTLEALICKRQADGHFSWSQRNFNDPVPNVGYKNSEILVDDHEFILINTALDLLGTESVQNLPAQTFRFTLRKEAFLNAAQRQNLSRGQVVEVEWKFFLRAVQSVRDENGTHRIGVRTGGSYYIPFNLQLENGALVIR